MDNEFSKKEIEEIKKILCKLNYEELERVLFKQIKTNLNLKTNFLILEEENNG